MKKPYNSKQSMTHMLGIINNFFEQTRFALDASREVESDVYVDTCTEYGVIKYVEPKRTEGTIL